MSQPQLLDGRYRVVKKLSQGGFGVTYLAQDTRRPGEPLCVAKELRHEHHNNPKIIQLFHQEAEILERLGRHDQIPQLLASFHEADRLYLVQEYIEGTTLEHELRTPTGKRQKPEAEVISLLRDVLSVLAFVHQHQVIHRDIKPGNLIRRQRDGKFVLIDFGAVKALTKSQVNENGQITTTVSIGSPGYSPHEQIAQGNPRIASDIYALGMTAIEALTGLYPMELWTDPDTAQLVWTDHAQVSPKLAALLTQMVHHHFSRRFHNAGAALTALEGLTATASAPTQPAVTPSRSIPTVISTPPPMPSQPATAAVGTNKKRAVATEPSSTSTASPRRDVLKFLGFTAAGIVLAIGGQQLLSSNSDSNNSSGSSEPPPDDSISPPEISPEPPPDDSSNPPETSPEPPLETPPEPPPVDAAPDIVELTTRLPWLDGTATAEVSVNGEIVEIELDGDQAPYTAGNFVDLALRGVYDGTTFHRVVQSPEPFVVQGGDPQSADPDVPAAQLGTGGYIDPQTGDTRQIPLEILVTGETQPRYGVTLSEAGVEAEPVLTHRRGAIAAARAGVNTASSQFYITLADVLFLDGDYAVFGYVTGGMEVVDSIQINDVITSVRITSGADRLIQPAE